MYTTDAKGKKVLIQSNDDPFALPNIPSETPDRPRGIKSRVMSVLGKRRITVTNRDESGNFPPTGTDGSGGTDQILLPKPMNVVKPGF